MTSPVISLDSAEQREQSIKLMVSLMKFRLAEADEGSMDARSAEMLIELMPVFIRFLDRERRAFIEGIKHDDREDKDAPLEEFLQMMTLPLVNMLGAALMTIVPQNPGIEVERKGDMRMMLLRNVMDNLFNGVVGYFSSAEDLTQEANGDGKLHS